MDLSNKFSYVIGTVAGLILFFIIWILHDDLQKELVLTFWFACFCLPLNALTKVKQAVSQALQHIILSQLPEKIIFPLCLGLLSLLFFFLNGNALEAQTVMSFNIITSSISLVVIHYCLFKYVLPEPVKRAKLDRDYMTWFRKAFPLFFISGMHVINGNTDIVMIGTILGTKIAGIYASASKLAVMMAFGMGVANYILAPIISELYHTKQYTELQHIVSLSAFISSVFAIIALTSILFFGEIVLGLFGQEFIGAYDALIILAVGQTINALAGSVGFLLTMTQYQQIAVIVIGVSTLLNIGLNAIMIPKWGIEGSAFATAISVVFWNVTLFFFVVKKINVNASIFSLVRLKW
jgi:O-antigen/teichoic acid export membrane protein